MANVTRDDLIDAVTHEHSEGFTYDDAAKARTIEAIRNVTIADLANVTTLEDIDVTTCDDATLVASTLEFHYGIGFDLTD